MPARSRIEKERRRKLIEAIATIIDSVDEPAEVIEHLVNRKKVKRRHGPKMAWPTKSIARDNAGRQKLKKIENVRIRQKVVHGNPSKLVPGATAEALQKKHPVRFRRLDRGVSGQDFGEKKQAAKG
jgi:hypothetical protein